MSGTSTGPGPSFLRVLNSEFIKFRTLLSTLILLGCTVLVVVGFGALSAWGTGQFAEAAATDPEAAAAFASQGGDLAVGVPTSGIAFAQLILGSLGVLLMSSEFTTGMARSTFAAVPKRIPAFAAKLLVVMVTAFVLTAASVYLAGLVSLPILDNYNLKLDLASSQSVKMLLVNSLYVAAVAAIGMALGSLIRNSAGGIMSLVGSVLRGTDRLPADPGRLLRRGPQVPARQHGRTDDRRAARPGHAGGLAGRPGAGRLGGHPGGPGRRAAEKAGRLGPSSPPSRLRA